jgi:hypothetical protein
MRALAVLSLLLELGISQSPAHAFDGNQVLQLCENTGGYNEGFCLGYLLGLVDSLINGAAPIMCRSESSDHITLEQNRDIILKYLRDHPENRHCGAIDITCAALRTLFRCSGKSLPPMPAKLC